MYQTLGPPLVYQIHLGVDNLEIPLNFLRRSVTCTVSGFPLPRWQRRYDSYNSINVAHLVFHRF